MSFWDKIISTISGADNKQTVSQEVSHDASRYGFVDAEVGIRDHKINHLYRIHIS